MRKAEATSSNGKPKVPSAKPKASSKTSTAEVKRSGSSVLSTKTNDKERESRSIRVEDRQPHSGSHSRTRATSRSRDVSTIAESIEGNQLEIARVKSNIAQMEQDLNDIAKTRSAITDLEERLRVIGSGFNTDPMKSEGSLIAPFPRTNCFKRSPIS
jgi:hypothetical protein